MANHGPVYGLDAELAAKREAQYDPSLERQAKEYITSKTGTQINDFHGDLKSGVVLCKLANALGANIKIQTSTMPFKMMENIEAYLKFCSSCGLRTHDLFQTVDLYEAKNLNQVVNNLLQLKKIRP